MPFIVRVVVLEELNRLPLLTRGDAGTKLEHNKSKIKYQYVNALNGFPFYCQLPSCLGVEKDFPRAFSIPSPSTHSTFKRLIPL